MKENKTLIYSKKLKNEETHYFDEVKVGDDIYSIVFGSGKVIFVLPEKQRVQGFYAFQVEYEDNETVYYTLDGIPNWCGKETECGQTIFYPDDVSLKDLDFKPLDKIPSKKKVMKLKDEDNLEMRCPSGLWRDIKSCPEGLVTKMLEKANLHLFRKGKKKKGED